MKAHELNLESIAFAELRMKIDNLLQKVVETMESKGLSEGCITAKIKISVMTGTDENGEIHSTAVFEPKVSCKIGSSYEDKCGATGGRITVQRDGTVVLGQISMDEVEKGA